jgi:hypothetical protein
MPTTSCVCNQDWCHRTYDGDNGWIQISCTDEARLLLPHGLCSREAASGRKAKAAVTKLVEGVSTENPGLWPPLVINQLQLLLLSHLCCMLVWFAKHHLQPEYLLDPTSGTIPGMCAVVFAYFCWQDCKWSYIIPCRCAVAFEAP